MISILGVFNCPSEVFFKNNTKVNAVYEFACAIFREVALIFQYTFILGSTFCNRLPFFPAPFPRKFLQMITYNIGNLDSLIKSIIYAWKPIPKELFTSLGRSEGFRISHDITYKPANGLCLGISLLFLSLFNKTNNLLESAKTFQGGAPETAVKIQALYDTLLGIKGSFKNKDVNLQNPLIQNFIEDSEKKISPRQYIFNELEKQNTEITPDIYALGLELDATWHYLNYPGEKKYDYIQTSIVEVLAKDLGFDSANYTRIQTTCCDAGEIIKNFEEGTYLIQFVDHTVALVKTHSNLAILDPYQGLAILDPKDQNEGLLHFLEFYGIQRIVSFNVINLFKKKLIL